MPPKNFDLLSIDEARDFDLSADVLIIAAAAGATTIVDAPDHTDIMVNGKTLRFGFTLAQMTPVNVSFLDGSLFVGNAGSETINGATGGDQIIGREGDDILFGNGGADKLIGNSGNDHFYFISGDPGRDTIFGGQGNDRVDYSTNDYTGAADAGILAYGNLGNDTLILSDGADTGFGGADNDIIYGLAGHDVLNGNAGFDTIRGGEGNDTIRGGDGDDMIQGGAGNDLIYGNTGDDFIDYAPNAGESGVDTVYAGVGFDAVLYSQATGQVFAYGNLDDDNIQTGSANDFIFGGQGNDTIASGAGDDAIAGNAGNDYIYLSAGNDIINGGDGNDTIEGEYFDLNAFPVNFNLYYVDYGHDLITGGAGDDRISANRALGGQNIFGDDGNDTLNGSNYDGDLIYGGAGDDFIVGGGGPSDDTLYGGDGNDFIEGSSSRALADGYVNGGTTRYIGGAGIDTINILDFTATGAEFTDLVIVNPGDAAIPTDDFYNTNNIERITGEFDPTHDKIVTGVAGTADNYVEIAGNGYDLIALLDAYAAIENGKTYVLLDTAGILGTNGNNNFQFLIWDADGDHVADSALRFFEVGSGIFDFGNIV